MSDLTSASFVVKDKKFAPVLIKFMDASQPVDGAKPSLYAATQPDVNAGDFIGPTGTEERTGTPGKVPLPPQAADKAKAERLWSVSEEHLGIAFTI